MSTYQIVEAVVITLAVVVSANQVLRQFAPRLHQRLRVSAAEFFGLKRSAENSVAASGCDSGCGSCATGCATTDTTAKESAGSSQEQPLDFHPRKG